MIQVKFASVLVRFWRLVRGIKVLMILWVTLKSAMRMPGFYYWASLGIAVLLFLVLRKEKLEKRFAVSILVAYLFLVLGSTIFRRSPQSEMLYRLDPFRSYRVILQKGIHKARSLVAQVLLNILMISPIGFLMPCFVKKKRFVVLFGLLFSLFIEVLQLVVRKGCFETEDLFNNTLGVVLACGYTELIRRIFVSKNNLD